MNQTELNFIIKMRDEASAVLKAHAQSYGSAADGAKNLKNNANEAAASISNLVKHAKEAAEAVAALWTANEIAHKSLDAFREYELGMQAVSRTTQMAGEHMVEFQAKFDAMATRVKGVPVHELVEFTEVAGQLGIRGDASILKFSETIGELTKVTNIMGEEGAKQFGRLLLLTGESAAGTQKLADSLTGLQATTKASAAEMLMMASNLAQTTSGFKLGTAELTGFAAAAAQLNIQPYLLSNAVGRTLREIKDGALNATSGMKDLTTMLGTSREEFLKLIETNPDQALIRFLNVVKQIGANGQSVTGFLQKFQLQGDESQKVLLTLAKNVDEVNQKVQESKNLQDGGGSLAGAYKGYSETLDASLSSLGKAWDLFAKNMGKALTPAVKEIAGAFTSILNDANALFTAIPDIGQKFVAWGVVAVPALVGIQRVIKMFPALFEPLSAGIAMVGRQFGLMATQATTAAAATAEAQAVMSKGGLAAGAAGLGGKLMKGVGIASLFVASHEMGKWVGESLNEYAPDTADAIARWRDGMWAKVAPPKTPEKKKEAEAVVGGELHDRAPVANVPDLPPVNPVFLMTDKNKAALEQFDKYTKLTQQLKDAEGALLALREGSKGKKAGDGDAKTDADIKAIENAIAQAQRGLDPMNKLRDSWRDQLAAAQSVTKEEQNQAAIEKAINEERRNNPRFTEDNAGEIRRAMEAMQAAEKRKAYDEQLSGLQKQLSALRALTEADKERVEIDQQIADFVKQNGEVSAEQERVMRRMLALQKETAEAASLEATLNSQGKAIQNYERQVQLLEKMHLSAEAMARAMGQLSRETEAARNPLGAIATQNEHELETLTKTGHYRDAEVAALQQKYELQSKGVEVDAKMLNDLTEYQKRLQDLKEAQTTGFAGWANKVKDVQGQLGDLANDFSNDLAGAIEGALSGKKNAFAEAGRQLGASMIKMATEGLMKQAFVGPGLTDTTKQASAALAASDKLRAGGEAQMKLATTQTMQVQAGVVNIQGSSGGALTAGQTVDGHAANVQSIANDGLTPAPATEKLKQAFTSATAPTMAAHAETVKKAVEQAHVTGIEKAMKPTSGASPFGDLGAAKAAFASKPAIPSGMADNLVTGKDLSGAANYNGGSLNSVQGFIVHHTGGRGSPEGVVNTLNQRGLGVQYVMDRDGKVSRTLPQGAKGAHILPSEINGLSNRNTEGMEVIAKNDSDLTDAQKAAFVPWMRKYQQEHPGAQVFGHGEVNPHHKMSSEGRTLTEEWRNASKTQPSITRSTPDIPLQNRTLLGYATGNVETSGDGASKALQEALKHSKQAQEAMKQSMEGITQSTTGSLTSLTSGIGNVGQKALSAVPSMGNFGSSIEGLIGTLSKGVGGAGAGSGGGGGGIGGLFSMLFSAFHTGGVVGSGGSGLSRSVSPLIFAGAPRFHTGLTSDEFPAILQKGERVLTANQDSRATALMGKMAGMIANGHGQQAAPQAPAAQGRPAPKITMNINTPNASSFRYSQGQIMAQTNAQMSRASAEHN